MKITTPTIVFRTPREHGAWRRELFCSEGRRWLRDRVRRGLRRWSSAWRDCPNAGWMAWWLVEYQNVPLKDIELLAASLLGDRYNAFRVNEFTLQGFTQVDRIAFGQLLRRTYNWKGERIA